MKEYQVPDECYKEFGSDLDGCCRQELQGCKGCVCLKEVEEVEEKDKYDKFVCGNWGGMSHHINTEKVTENDLKCPICGKPLYIQETSGIAACSDADCEYGHI